MLSGRPQPGPVDVLEDVLLEALFVPRQGPGLLLLVVLVVELLPGLAPE